MIDSKAERSRLQMLISDTVTLLCKNGLNYSRDLQIQGLIGVTIDDDQAFIIHFNESINNEESSSNHFQSLNDDIYADTQASSSSQAVLQNNIKTKKSSRKPKSKTNKTCNYNGTETEKPIENNVSENVAAAIKVENSSNYSQKILNEVPEHHSEGLGRMGGSVDCKVNKLRLKIKCKQEDCAFVNPQNNDNSNGSASRDNIIDMMMFNHTPVDSMNDELNKVTEDSSQLSADSVMDEQQEWSDSALQANNAQYRRLGGKRSKDLIFCETLPDGGLHYCDMDGCDKKFLHRRHLLRHQTFKHGRIPKRRTAHSFYLNRDAAQPYNILPDGISSDEFVEQLGNNASVSLVTDDSSLCAGAEFSPCASAGFSPDESLVLASAGEFEG